MDFTIFSNFFSLDYSSVLVTLAATLFCFVFTTAVISRKLKTPSGLINQKPRDSANSSEDSVDSGVGMTARLSNGVGGGVASENGGEMATERQTGASMMEQLVPEITTHALSYLDYPSLCRLSMTNSLMRKAANDDNAWKALYHKDFTLEQDNVTPPNGWKAYYAATRAIVNLNVEFFRIIRERLLQDMTRLWLNADYVKCFHANGEAYSGYVAVMESWQLEFNYEHVADIQIQDLRTRVLSSMAWVTMKVYIDGVGDRPFNVTNIYELHNGRWYMVHHHSTTFLMHVGVQQILHV